MTSNRNNCEVRQMTLKEAAQLALEALESYEGFVDDAHIIEGQWHWLEGTKEAITALRQSLASVDDNDASTKRVDETSKNVHAPVAWVDLLKEAVQIVRGKTLWKKFVDGTPLANDIPVWMADFAQQHTHPKREWVGLTNPERAKIFAAIPSVPFEGNWHTDLVDAIEAKLKEKNGGQQ